MTALLGAAVLAAGLSMPACTVPDPFNAKYLDPALNWISDFGLDKPRSETASGWAFDYEASADWDGFDYMRLEATGSSVGSGAVTGLAESVAVYRLSIENLLSDPDMEGETVGAPGARWSVDHDPAQPLQPDPSITIVAAGIHGNSFSFTRDQVGQYARLLLSPDLRNTASGLGPQAGSIYQINLLCLDDSLSLSYSLDGISPQFASILANTVSDIRIQSQAFLDPAQDYAFYFGPGGTQAALIDDIRIIRRSIPLALSLDQSLSDADPSYISGRYVFSVWVKNDETASYLFAASAQAPYQTRRVSLEIRAKGRTDGGAISVLNPADEASGWAQWTKLSVEIPQGEKLAIDQTETTAIFSLKISPTDILSSDGLDAATILIAQPELTFHLKSGE